MRLSTVARVMERWAHADNSLRLYPDPSAGNTRVAAARYGVSPEQVLAGNGRRLPDHPLPAFLAPGDR